jgi:predicted lactoylglutathione lyase
LEIKHVDEVSLRLTAVTLGVSDLARSARFYEALGLVLNKRASSSEVAFFAAGGVMLALYPWDKLAEDTEVPVEPRPSAFRGITLAWNCASPEVVDSAFGRALASGGRALKRPERTFWGGYSGYFADLDEHPWEVVHAPMFPLNSQGMLTLPS